MSFPLPKALAHSYSLNESDKDTTLITIFYQKQKKKEILQDRVSLFSASLKLRQCDRPPH